MKPILIVLLSLLLPALTGAESPESVVTSIRERDANLQRIEVVSTRRGHLPDRSEPYHDDGLRWERQRALDGRSQRAQDLLRVRWPRAADGDPVPAGCRGCSSEGAEDCL